MFEQWREQRVLDVDAIRRVAFEYGLPDGPLRALYWRVLLGTRHCHSFIIHFK